MFFRPPPQYVKKKLETVFSLQLFYVHTTTGDFENTTITDLVPRTFPPPNQGKGPGDEGERSELCLWKSLAEKSRDYRDVIVFEKFRFQNVFRPH